MFIQVINLEKDKDRMTWMENHLNNFELDFSRVDAVRPDKLQGLDHFFQILLSRGLSKNEACCALSHYVCWKNFLASDQESCLVLEDDVHFSSDFKEILTNLQLEKTGRIIYKLETILATVTADFFGKKIGRRKLQRIYTNHGATAAYVLNRECARYLMEQFKNFKNAIDTEIFDFRLSSLSSVYIYQCVPACIMQDHKFKQPQFSGNITNRLDGITKEKFNLNYILKDGLRPIYRFFHSIVLIRKRKIRIKIYFKK